MSNYNKEYSDMKWFKYRLNPKVVKAVDEIKKHLGDEFTNGTWEEHLQCLQSVGLLDKDYNEIDSKFECYEIWRPNIPDNGCVTQCRECREKQHQLPKQPMVKMICTNEYKMDKTTFKVGDEIIINNYAYNISNRIKNHVIESHNGEILSSYYGYWISIFTLYKHFKVC